MKFLFLCAGYLALFQTVLGFADCTNFSGQWSGGCNRYKEDGSLFLQLDQTFSIVQIGCEEIVIGSQKSVIGGQSTETHSSSKSIETLNRSARWSNEGKALVIRSKSETRLQVVDQIRSHFHEAIENQTYSLQGGNLVITSDVDLKAQLTPKSAITHQKLKEQCSFSKDL